MILVNVENDLGHKHRGTAACQVNLQIAIVSKQEHSSQTNELLLIPIESVMCFISWNWKT
jgi:hypothetical protein